MRYHLLYLVRYGGCRSGTQPYVWSSVGSQAVIRLLKPQWNVDRLVCAELMNVLPSTAILHVLWSIIK